MLGWIQLVYCHVYVCDYRRGFGLAIGFIDHLHDSELQVIAALPLIPTLYKSPLTPLQPAVSSTAVPW
jgi:hypothetical protein